MILAVSPFNAKPYQFKLTGINVFSFEEALYHCYHYWKESIDDFTGEDFIAWVSAELGLSYLAIKIEEIAAMPEFNKRFLAFLSLIEYFDDEDLRKIREELVSWENRLEWEKYKERGDNVILSNPERAYSIYKKALMYGRNSALLNNIGVSLLKMGIYDEAVLYLEKAREDGGGDDFSIITNLISAYIYHGDRKKAAELLNYSSKFGDKSDISFLWGEYEYAAGEYRRSLEYYEKAISLCPDEDYIYRVTDVYIKLRLYEKAIDNLNLIENKNKKMLAKLAEVYINYNNIPAAIKCIKRALEEDETNVSLWTKLAAYCRLDYNLEAALEAAEKAISFEPENERANLEVARIKKALGKTKDYQTILHSILNKFKNRERDRHSIYS